MREIGTPDGNHSIAKMFRVSKGEEDQDPYRSLGLSFQQLAEAEFREAEQQQELSRQELEEAEEVERQLELEAMDGVQADSRHCHMTC